MKKILFSLLLIFTCGVILNVNAANYEIRELIPINIKTTIVTDNFSYKSFYFNHNEDSSTANNNYIVFSGIKNLSDGDLPISISIGLFGEDKKNIGTINYCSSSSESSNILKSKEEVTYSIEVSDKYLAEDKTVDDIKYIAVLSENSNCRTTGSLDYVGETVEEIGQFKNNTLSDDTLFLIKILSVVGGVLLILFLYKFLFTNAFRNFNGDDVRQEYTYINKQLRRKREDDERNKPYVEPKKKTNKSSQVLHQEEEAKNEDKTGTDLHNLYK